MTHELGDLVVDLAGQRRAARRGVSKESTVEGERPTDERHGPVLRGRVQGRAQSLIDSFDLVLTRQRGRQVALGSVQIVEEEILRGDGLQEGNGVSGVLFLRGVRR